MALRARAAGRGSGPGLRAKAPGQGCGPRLRAKAAGRGSGPGAPRAQAFGGPEHPKRSKCTTRYTVAVRRGGTTMPP
ncbi:hypothetical protein GCM10017744_044970 [Streptomyces antimycoticus]|uniref:Uncharacterized protein n=1 Tax=Streptomyces antimycoticus TaxID=68175 RepID=A0A4D4K6Y5_9ACTN|nr:hypothetical protein SANT12839_057430 [Streptomyces antimycoticus]